LSLKEEFAAIPEADERRLAGEDRAGDGESAAATENE
jgi:hypothetical protein